MANRLIQCCTVCNCLYIYIFLYVHIYIYIHRIIYIYNTCVYLSMYVYIYIYIYIYVYIYIHSNRNISSERRSWCSVPTCLGNILVTEGIIPKRQRHGELINSYPQLLLPHCFASGDSAMSFPAFQVSSMRSRITCSMDLAEDSSNLSASYG